MDTAANVEVIANPNEEGCHVADVNHNASDDTDSPNPTPTDKGAMGRLCAVGLI